MDTEEKEAPKNDISRLCILERSALRGTWGQGRDQNGLGSKQADGQRRRTKELPGGLETLRTTVSF